LPTNNACKDWFYPVSVVVISDKPMIPYTPTAYSVVIRRKSLKATTDVQFDIIEAVSFFNFN
jgi:hypothetical protein